MSTYQTNDAVLYISEGVCKIEDIQTKDFFNQQRRYYVLRPIYHAGATVFVPCEGGALQKMHPILKSTKSISEQFHSVLAEPWIESDPQRKLHFRALIDNGTLQNRIGVYKAILEKERVLQEQKKHLRTQDERYKKELERLLIEEFSAVCEKDPTETEEILKAL